MWFWSNIRSINTTKNINIDAIENNEYIYNSIKNNKDMKLFNMDYLKFKPEKKYDLIIGNPPYFVMKKDLVSKDYLKFFDGRPNIFVIFIIKSILELNNNGILSFVLPKNFLNCLYYNKLRKYIFKKMEIVNIIECYDDNYLETLQDTIIFTIKNNKDNKNTNNSFTIKMNDFYIFNTKQNIKKILKLYENSTNLNDMGFEVSIGNIVWNQVKDKLTDDKNKTRLIYSSDIINNELSITKYNNKQKKNYINKDGNTDIILVVNRGYGKGNFNFTYALINLKTEYLIENHLICIKLINNTLSKKLQIKKYNELISSFNNKKTLEFIKLLFTNNAINLQELRYIFPIYLNKEKS